MLLKKTQEYGGNINRYCTKQKINEEKANLNCISNWIWNMYELLKNQKKIREK